MLWVGVDGLAGLLQEWIGMQESDPLLQACRVYQLGRKLACVHQVEEVAEDIWLYVSSLQAHTVTEKQIQNSLMMLENADLGFI